MSVEVDFAQYGIQFLGAGQNTWWWYTWIYDGNHWSRMSALPVADSPPGGSIKIVDEWSTGGTLHVHWLNNGTDTVVFRPTVIVAPSRF